MWRICCVPAPEIGRPNQDAVIVIDDVAVVVDGAGVPTAGCEHGVAWYARRLCMSTIDAIIAHPARSLAAGLADGIARVADAHRDHCDLDDPRTPAAAVGIVRVPAGKIDILSLADVNAVIATETEVTSFFEETAKIREAAACLKGKRIGAASHASAVREMLEIRAEECNQAEGFWVAAADPSVAYRANVTTFRTDGPARVALLSDGASWPVTYGMYSWREWLCLLAEEGPCELVRRVRAIEQADPYGELYPRVKRHDDASVATTLLSLPGPWRGRQLPQVPANSRDEGAAPHSGSLPFPEQQLSGVRNSAKSSAYISQSPVGGRPFDGAG